MTVPDDFRDLLAKAQQGDREATGIVLEAIRPWLWQAARGFADPERPDESTADLAQAAWLRAWQSLGQFEGPAGVDAGDDQTQAMFRAWLTQIVRRLGMNAVRDRQAAYRNPPGRLARLDASPIGDATASWRQQHPESSDPSPSQQAEVKDQIERIRKALAGLDNEEDRQIVQMRFLDGLSLRQIARSLGHNHEYVRQRFHAALRTLERELEGLR